MRKYEITLNKIHICDEDCAFNIETITVPVKSMPGCFSLKQTKSDNPTYINGKCSESGTEEEIGYLHIASFDKTKNNIANPDEIVITDNRYTICFDYPLNGKYDFTFDKPNGFTRLDVVNNIVDTYKYIYQKEEETASDLTLNFESKCNGCGTMIVEKSAYVINEEDTNCVICLEAMPKNTVGCKLVCNHIYHKDCIATWLEKHLRCPLCNETKLGVAETKCNKCENGVITKTFIGKVVPVEMRGSFMNRHETDGIYGIWGHDIGDLGIERLTYNPNNKSLSMSIGS